MFVFEFDDEDSLMLGRFILQGLGFKVRILPFWEERR